MRFDNVAIAKTHECQCALQNENAWKQQQKKSVNATTLLRRYHKTAWNLVMPQSLKCTYLRFASMSAETKITGCNNLAA